MEKCPDLVVVPPDYPMYVEASRHFVSILRQFSPCVKQYSIDEAWDGSTPLQQLGMLVTRLSDEPYQQYDLFSGVSPVQYERKLRLDEGEDIIRRTKFAQDPQGHMAGGLDKVRRTGVIKPAPDEI